jgi:hypothetical protein
MKMTLHTVNKTDLQRKQVKSIFYFKWTIGELLFNRQRKIANYGRIQKVLAEY